MTEALVPSHAETVAHSDTALAHSQALRRAIEAAGAGLVERAALVETIALAAVAGEHILVIGPPGTAKSEAARRVATALGGRYFEYLLGRFTEPGEIFGPVDLVRLREGFVETRTENMLPEADFAFLDEIFLGSTAILNTLLGILNERTFRRGHTVVHCPLRTAIGAANALPQDSALEAFADRFLVRVFLDAVPDPRLEELLEGGWSAGQTAVGTGAHLSDIDALATLARGCDLSAVRPVLADAIRKLRGAGINLSDRRAVRVQRLIAAAAALDGRSAASTADLWALILAVPTREDQERARELLRAELDTTRNRALMMAAEEASAGPLARAARLVAVGQKLLANPAAGNTWRLKLEGVAREIDAGFLPEAMPAELATLRDAIRGQVSGEV